MKRPWVYMSSPSRSPLPPPSPPAPSRSSQSTRSERVSHEYPVFKKSFTILKMVIIYRWTYLQSRNKGRDVANEHGYQVKKEGGMNWKTWIGKCRLAQRLKCLPAVQETWVQSLGWEDPWRRKWQPTPVFLPGESHGWRSLVGYSPRGRKELDTTEWQLSNLHFHV